MVAVAIFLVAFGAALWLAAPWWVVVVFAFGAVLSVVVYE